MPTIFLPVKRTFKFAHVAELFSYPHSWALNLPDGKTKATGGEQVWSEKIVSKVRQKRKNGTLALRKGKGVGNKQHCGVWTRWINGGQRPNLRNWIMLRVALETELVWLWLMNMQSQKLLYSCWWWKLCREKHWRHQLNTIDGISASNFDQSSVSKSMELTNYIVQS